eukprot:TRINITY_DN1951_c1_g1_i1.p1 TRINITY_DN1951_c1_g1~~TRINITY_DN1951_c1_g1_i1.p1  ORF type:complete len:500 (+),score=129.29 TRINITY_DN1951_c1_g1_i1:125-1624(+)
MLNTNAASSPSTTVISTNNSSNNNGNKRTLPVGGLFTPFSVELGSGMTAAQLQATWKRLLEKQRERYGKELFEKDTAGNHVCFFKNCRKAFLQNFSRHIQKHELHKDLLDESHVKSVLGTKASKALIDAYRSWTLSAVVTPPQRPPSSPSFAATTPTVAVASGLYSPMGISTRMTTPNYSPFSSFALTRAPAPPLPKQHIVSSSQVMNATSSSSTNKKPLFIVAGVAVGKRFRGCLTILRKLRRLPQAQHLGQSEEAFMSIENRLHQLKSYREFKAEVEALFQNMRRQHPTQSESINALVREFEQLYQHKLRKYEARINNSDSFSDECAKCYDGGTLLCCEGSCMRGFHLACIGLQQDPPANTTWLCPECLHGVYVVHHDSERDTYFYFSYNPNPTSHDPFQALLKQQQQSSASSSSSQQQQQQQQQQQLPPQQRQQQDKPVGLCCDLELTKEQKMLRRKDDEEKRDVEMVYDPYFACWIPKNKQIAEQRFKRQRLLLQ